MYTLQKIGKENTYFVTQQNNSSLFLYHWTNQSAMESVLGLNNKSDMEIKGNDARGQVNFFASFEKLGHEELVSSERTKRPLNVSIQNPGEKQFLLSFKFEMTKNLDLLVHYTGDAFASVSSKLNSTLESYNYHVPRVIHFFDDDDSTSNSMTLEDIDHSWHTCFDLGVEKDLQLFLTFEGISTTAYSHGDYWHFEKFRKPRLCNLFKRSEREFNKLVKNVNKRVGQKVRIVQKKQK